MIIWLSLLTLAMVVLAGCIWGLSDTCDLRDKDRSYRERELVRESDNTLARLYALSRALGYDLHKEYEQERWVAEKRKAPRQ